MIVTDEWFGYNRIGEDGYTCQTVNHSKCFVNPKREANTQGIKGIWVDSKMPL